MAIHHLILPGFIEPPPRVPVVAKPGVPMPAVPRRYGVYRYIAEPAPQGTHSWMERAVRRR